MILTLDLLSEVAGFQVIDEDGVMNEWRKTEVEEPKKVDRGFQVEVSFFLLKSNRSFNNSAFGGTRVTFTIVDGVIYDVQ